MFRSSGVRVYFLLVNSINIAISDCCIFFFHLMRNGKYYFLGATLRDAILQNVTSSQQKILRRRMRFSLENREAIVIFGNNCL